MKILIKRNQHKGSIFNKANRKAISGSDIKKAIALNIWGDMIHASQITILSIKLNSYHYNIDFKVKSEGDRTFSIVLKYGKVIEKNFPRLRLL